MMPWPAVPLSEWQPTRDTLQLWTQIVGKVKLAHEPLTNHWWSIPLYVSARGLTTSIVPHPTGPSFQIDFDLRGQRLELTTSAGDGRSLPLVGGPISSFYDALTDALDQVGVPTSIWPMPVEIEDASPFTDDHTHGAYDPDHAVRFWLALVEIEKVMARFRADFVGKASPVHLFWGGLDLAATRFSGRTAPPHPGGAPHCGRHVMLEAYSHEVSSAGYWPGGAEEGVFYSYAYPEPAGFREFPIRPTAAVYNTDLGEFVLPYENVRKASDPAGTLLDFLQTSYDAAATCADWDRAALERR